MINKKVFSKISLPEKTKQINERFMITWYVRWFILAIVAVSIWDFVGYFSIVILGLLLLAASYNLMLYIALRLSPQLLEKRSFLVIVDSLLVICLMFLTGGLASPYSAIIPFIVISASYWIGLNAALISGIGIGLVTIAISLLTSTTVHDYDFVVRLVLYISVGVFVAWLTRAIRLESKTLIKLEHYSESESHKLDSLINLVKDAVLVVDKEGFITLRNAVARNLLFFNEVDTKPKLASILKFYDNPDHFIDLSNFNLIKLNGRTDCKLLIADGTKISVEISVSEFIVDSKNEGYVLIIRDITQDKTIEEERDEFIAVASHELRTPLTIAQGYLSLVSGNSNLEAEVQNDIDGAMRSLDQLTHIITDLVRLTDVNDEVLPVDIEAFDPVKLVSDLIKDFEDEASNKGLNLSVNVDDSQHIGDLFTSRFLVQQILSSLLSNAIKFTDQGYVKLNLRKSDSPNNGVLFVVEDTGPGIAKNEQDMVFKKFFQSENYMKRVHGGTGLGLYIAARIAKRLTAKIWFESEKDKGSKFFLFVPSYDKDNKDREKVAQATIHNLFSDF